MSHAILSVTYSGHIICTYMKKAMWSQMECSVMLDSDASACRMCVVDSSTIRLAIITVKTPQTICIYDIYADYAIGILKVSSNPTATIRAPQSSKVPKSSQSVIDQYGTISKLQDSSASSSQHHTASINGTSRFEKMCFDPVNPNVLITVTSDGSTNFLQRWTSHIQPTRIKCPIDTTPYETDANASNLTNAAEVTAAMVDHSSADIEVGTTNNGNYSFAEDDMNLDATFSTNVDDMFYFANPTVPEEVKPMELVDSKNDDISNSNIDGNGNKVLDGDGSTDFTLQGSDFSHNGPVSNDVPNSVPPRSSFISTEQWDLVRNLEPIFPQDSDTSAAEQDFLSRIGAFVAHLIIMRDIIAVTSCYGCTYLYYIDTLEPILDLSAESKLSKSRSSLLFNGSSSKVKWEELVPNLRQKRKLDLSASTNNVMDHEVSINSHMKSSKRRKLSEVDGSTIDEDHKYSEDVEHLINSATNDVFQNGRNHLDKSSMKSFLMSIHPHLDSIPPQNQTPKRKDSENFTNQDLKSSTPISCQFVSAFSPNQSCLAVMHPDLSIRVYSLSLLLKHRILSQRTGLIATSANTNQRNENFNSLHVSQQLVNLLETSILSRKSHWDIIVMMISITKDNVHFPSLSNLHRNVLLLLNRDMDRLDPKRQYQNQTRFQFEVIKSSIYRSSADSTNGYTCTQMHLVLLSILKFFRTTFRCEAWVLANVDGTPKENPDLDMLFSGKLQAIREYAKVDRDNEIPAVISNHTKWISSMVHRFFSSVNLLIKKISGHKEMVHQQQLKQQQLLQQQHLSYFVTDEYNLGMSSSGKIHFDSPMGITPRQQTPSSAGLGMITESPKSNPESNDRRATAVTSSHSSSLPTSSTILDYPSILVSQLAVVPETLEELLLICPDQNTEMGLLWCLDTQTIQLLKQAVLYATICHVMRPYVEPKDQLTQADLSTFLMLSNLKSIPTFSMLRTPQRTINDDWIQSQIIPSLYGIRNEYQRPPQSDLTLINLAPLRQRFLEVNFFGTESTNQHQNNFLASFNLDRTISHTILGNSDNAERTKIQEEAFWHLAVAKPINYTHAIDIVVSIEVRGDVCRSCVCCNRMSAVSSKARDACDLTKACPVCGGSWILYSIRKNRPI